MPFRCIVGLGNPGARYVETRHNLGFQVLDRLASKQGWNFQSAFQSSLLVGKHQGNFYLKPQSFMNRSGEPLQQWLKYFQVPVEDLVVVVDDIELDLGQIRIRPSGGCGGHNGLRSIEESLGTQNYTRIRCGVGKCPPEIALEEFVLRSYLPDQKEKVSRMIDQTIEAIESVQREGLEVAMNRYNRKLEKL